MTLQDGTLGLSGSGPSASAAGRRGPALDRRACRLTVPLLAADWNLDALRFPSPGSDGQNRPPGRSVPLLTDVDCMTIPVMLRRSRLADGRFRR